MSLSSQQPEEETEITRDDAMKSLLTDEDLSDLTLRGSDGVQVLANRCILASRSPVFRRMLFGNFKEASNTIVDVDYNGKVLQAIVNYIYTDEIPEDDIPDCQIQDEEEGKEWDISMVRFLVTLIDATNYFELPKMKIKILEFIDDGDIIFNDPDLSMLILAVCPPPNNDCGDDAATTTTKELRNFAQESLMTYPQHIVNDSNSVLRFLHSSYIKNILTNKNLPLDEYSCFQILESWATKTTEEEEDDDDGNDNNHNDDHNIELNHEPNDTKNLTKRSRKRLAKEMISHIQLEDIAPKELSTSVTSSGLVTAEQLSNAYKAQALRAQKKPRLAYNQWRQAPVWELTETAIFEPKEYISTSILKCRLMTSGIHKWSIKVLDGYHHVQLGVASLNLGFNMSDPISDQKNGWALCNRFTKHDGATVMLPSNMPRFTNGSIITFIFNLDEGDGTLSASIDDSVPFRLFSGMDQRSEGEEDANFVPAVSGCFYQGGRMEFLGFEYVDVA